MFRSVGPSVGLWVGNALVKIDEKRHFMDSKSFSAERGGKRDEEEGRTRRRKGRRGE